MALELTIYNRQTQTSKSGKEYIGYVVAFAPGQRGATCYRSHPFRRLRAVGHCEIRLRQNPELQKSYSCRSRWVHKSTIGA